MRGHPSPTFVALLLDTVTRVTLKNALTSDDDVARGDSFDWPLSVFLSGVLVHFEFRDCYAALERKGLDQIEPRSAKYPGGKQ